MSENHILPSGWRKARLSDIADIRFSNVDKKTTPGEASVRLCNYVDVYNNEYVTRGLDFMEATATPNEMTRFSVQQGDVIITKDSETPDDIGVPAIVLDEIPGLVCGYHLALIKPNKQEVEPIFVGRQIGHERIAHYFSRLANGSTRYGLSASGVENAPLHLPPLPEQRKIAAILTTVDGLIEKTEALIGKYQSVKQGLMGDLFTRGVDPHGRLRPPRTEAPQLYKQSQLGWIPKEWEVESLGANLEGIDGGWSPDCIEQPPPIGDWGVLKVSAVTRGRFLPIESKTLPPHLKPRPEIEVHAGDVILTRSNGVAELVGMTVQVEETRDRLMLSDKLLRIRPRLSRLENDFLAMVMQSEPTRRQIAQVLSGSSGQRNISQAEFKSLAVMVPPLVEQHAIVGTVQSLGREVEHEARTLEKFRLLKTGLMQDLLTGKVRVKVDGVAAQEATG